MTKDELESKFDDFFDENTRASEGGCGPDVTDKMGMWRAFQPIISKFAKQQAIAFDKWKIENKWILNAHESSSEYYQWIGDSGIDCVVKSPEQLYLQFIEQQTKDK